jgi:azurin
MDGVRMVGKEQSLPEVARPLRQHNPEWGNAEIRYLGYYMHNDQILFHLSINGTEYLDTPRMVDGVFERIVAPKQNHPLNGLLHGGQTQWPDIIETDITLGKGNGLVVDTIALPTQNPWRTIVSCGDHGFLADGTAIVVTMQGDVWRVENIAYDSSKTGSDPKARWRRIANGLHQALGVWVQNDEIYVLGRNQITRLHDLNGDHEIDRYECFSDSFVTSPGGHDFICGLQRDDQGNFYTASGNQGILQISPDGKTTTVIATGFRNPDGIGILPDGTITVPSSEGDWTPTSMIAQIHPRPSLETGKRVFETAPIPFYGYRGPAKDQKVQLPLVYLPRGIDNSSGGQVWIDDTRMGPLDQKIVHTSFGAGTAFVVLRDRVDNMWQGGIVPLPGEYRAGVHRAHLNKKDGQLYLSGMNGWGSYTPDAGCFQRLRYTGSDIQMIDGFHVHSNGVSVRFTQPVNRKMAEDASNHFAQCWNYRYSPGYGSKEYSALHPPMIGHDRLRVQGAYLAGDNQTLFLEIPELQRCNQLHLYLQIDESEPKELFATVHALDADKRDIPNYRENTNKVLAPHPMERDLEWLQRSIPNPWQKRLEQARNIRIESRDNLQFSTKTLEVTAGERLKLTFGNPDVVPHNWALLKPNTLQTIGELANRMVNDPDAYLRHYVPDSQDVICYTDVVDPKAEFSIYFEAPSEPGKYPYLCTFPGHWMVMNGEMIVKPK